MLNYISKIILFYFAYLPLFIILTINNISDGKTILFISALLVIIGFGLVCTILKLISEVVPSQEKFEILENKNSEYLGFLVTYILPFLVSFSTINQIFSFSLLMLLVAYLYIDTSLFCVNPFLKLFFKYNIYEVEFEKQKFYYLTQKKPPQGNMTGEIRIIGENILVD